MKIEDFTTEVMSEIVVAGFDPEAADMSNPDGYIYAMVYFVAVVRPDGFRYRHLHNFSDLEDAEELRLKVDGSDYIRLEYWDIHHPVYGSTAYEANIGEEIAIEKKEAEEELYR